MTTTKPVLTHTEAGHTSTLVCAWCIQAGSQEDAVEYVVTEKGTYPACQRHAEEAEDAGYLVGTRLPCGCPIGYHA